MRKSLLLVAFFLISSYLAAQESVKQKEISLVFSNLDNFGISFKTGTNHSLWRFGSLIIRGSNISYDHDFATDNEKNFGLNINVGKEFRKNVTEKVEFRYGADLSFGYNQIKTKNHKVDSSNYNYIQEFESTIYQPAINIVLGFNYKMSNNFIIGAEILPYVGYSTGETLDRIYNNSSYNNSSYNKEEKRDISGFNYGLSNNPVLLSLTYRY